MLTLILRYFGFPDCIEDFFSDYIIGRSTQYSWNSFLSGICDTDICLGQDSVLSLILLVLYIVLLIELRAQALNLNTFILSFIDDGLLIS